jgi:TPR repeat protein
MGGRRIFQVTARARIINTFELCRIHHEGDKMRLPFVAFLLASLLFASPALPVTNQLTPRQQHLIDELMEVTHVDQLSMQMFDATMAQMQTSALDRERFDRFRELARKQIDFKSLVREIYATIYIRYFTDDDLEAMIAFDKTPAGQKSITTMPKVIGEVMAAVQASVTPKIEEIYKQIESEERPERTTKSDMRKLATALDAWSTDHGGGFPQAGSIDALVKELSTYVRALPSKDVWGHPYAYAVSKDVNHYRIVSAGSDGTFERDSLQVTPVQTMHYSDGLQSDIIYGDGHFIAQPKAWHVSAPDIRNDKDESEAAKWTRKAAEQGDAIAQSNLGAMYGNGQGVTKDFAEEVKWYRAAADQGLATAQFNLAFSYEIGEGVTKDLTEAAKWYRKAADQNFSQAEHNLGNAYRNGAGVPQDYAEAAKLFRKAADQNYVPAIVNLAYSYEQGQGVSKDLNEAARWYRKAADQGDADGQLLLGSLYARGEGVPKDPAKALALYRKSAAQGDAENQFQVGSSLMTGDGIPKDEAEGMMWLQKAAAQGHVKAKEMLERLPGGP